jgi:DNA-binding response OmpR family regulator
LLVEDNKDTLRYLATVLRRRGHDVVIADSLAAARAAMEVEAEVPFDLVISDIELPDGNGLELMREIKAGAKIPGIAMSGFGAEEDLRQSRDAGFFDHLTKPIDMNRLDTAIRRATLFAASKDAKADDGAGRFRLRATGSGSGAFKIIWGREPESEKSSI